MLPSPRPPEGGRPPEPQPEEAVEQSESDIERLIDLKLESLLIEYGKKVNEGMNGVIFHLDLRGVSEENLAELASLGVDLNRDIATKVLKVYSHGIGKQEFEMQKLAHEALKGHPESAQVPEPLLYRDLQLTDEAKEVLAHLTKANQGRVEILMMDYIEGEDLATILFREALVRKFPEMYSSVDDLRGRTTESLQIEVAGALDFRAPGGKGGNEAEREFEKRKVAVENSSKLYRFLKSKGFVLDPKIVESLKGSIDALHANNIVHRDAHERNFMVSGGYEKGKADDAKVFMIDFGTAKRFEGSYQSGRADLFQDESGEKSYLQDEMVVNLLGPLAEGREEMLSRIRSETVQKVMGDLGRLRKDQDWVQKREDWFGRMDREKKVDAKERITSLFKHYISNKSRWSDDSQWNRLSDFVLSFVEKGMIEPEEAGTALVDLSSQDFPPVARNRLLDLAKAARAVELEAE